MWLLVDLVAGCTLLGCGEHGECGGAIAGSCVCSGNFLGAKCDACGDGYCGEQCAGVQYTTSVAGAPVATPCGDGPYARAYALLHPNHTEIYCSAPQCNLQGNDRRNW